MATTLEDIINLDPVKDKELLYNYLNEAGLRFKKTDCKKCLKDYKNMLLEELGYIKDASAVSEFNDVECEFVYTYSYSVSWNGYIINNNSPCELKEMFFKEHPKYFK